MGIAAQQDLDPGPVAPDAADEVLDDGPRFRARGRLAGPQDGAYRLAAVRLEDVDGQEAVAVVVGVEQRQLLPAMGFVPAVVDVEHDAPRQRAPAVAEQVDHRRHHARHRDLRRRVLQPRHGRLRAQRITGLRGAADRHLEDRIGAQGIAVVGVLVAGGDGEDTHLQHLHHAVRHPRRMAPVGQACGQALGDAEAVLHCAQCQHPAVRRQAAAVEADAHLLAGDGWQIKRQKRIIVHGGCGAP